MSEILAFHSAAPGASSLPLKKLEAMVEEDSSRLSDISFSGGSLSDAINYLINLGLTLIDIPLSDDADSYDIFGHTMVIIESRSIERMVERIEADAKAGLEIAENMLIVLTQALEKIEGQDFDLVIIW